MLKRGFLLALGFLVLPGLAWAKVDLYLWKSDAFDFEYLFPVREGEPPQAAMDRYLSEIETHPELKALTSALRTATAGTFTRFEPDKTPVALVIGNELDDQTARARRMHEVLDPLKKRGTQPVILPVAAALGLSENDAKDFRKEIRESFDLLVAVGGGDIHPAIYGEPNRHSKAPLLIRDQEELKLVKDYLGEAKGFFVGICRGHQLGAVTRGVLGPTVGVDVNSMHHQAVVEIPPDSGMRATALTKDPKPLIEVAEYCEQRGLSVQFHPERMLEQPVHSRFYDTLHRQALLARNARRIPILYTARPDEPRIDRSKVLFGIEYTFQDQGMVDEKGRRTFGTPHKQERFEAYRAAYLKELGVGEESLGTFGREDFKPGNTIQVPGDGQHVVNMEPVTIEVNTTPKILDQLEDAAVKVYAAAGQAKLVPYVQPAAERSGMGHIHVGAATIGESPFYRHPHLLRNIMVYLHKHPSLLWGFAEAYDIGLESNIESYHPAFRQSLFQKAVEEFDSWYIARAGAGEDLSDGLRVFLKALRKKDSDFFQHYRFINLEHLDVLPGLSSIPPSMGGKLTVEFRNFRPPRSPAHAKANAELLLGLMERFSEPGYLEPFQEISNIEYNRFFTASKVASDWKEVKKIFPKPNPLWDEMVQEYVDVQLKSRLVKTILGENTRAEVFPAYSEKTKKGTYFELRIPARGHEVAPRIRLGDRKLAFEKIKLGKREYWISHFEADSDFLQKVGASNVAAPDFCRRAFSIF